MAVRFSVQGVDPKAWANNEWDWRAAVAEAVRGHVSEEQRVELARHAAFEVKAIFRIRAPGFAMADLDNLAKPLLDTLFHAKHVQAKRPDVSGVLVEQDDAAVHRLTLEKRFAASVEEAGVDVEIAGLE